MSFSSFLIRRISLIRLKICQGVTSTPKQTAKRIFSSAQKAYAPPDVYAKGVAAPSTNSHPQEVQATMIPREKPPVHVPLSLLAIRAAIPIAISRVIPSSTASLTATFLLCEIRHASHNGGANLSTFGAQAFTAKITSCYRLPTRMTSTFHDPIPPQKIFHEYRIKHLV